MNWIERNLALNHVDPRSHRVVEADPVQFTSDSAKESFDLIVVAPPSALGPATARRTRVAGSFPDGKSAVMLVAARLRHIAGTRWGKRIYLDMDRLREVKQAADEIAIA